MDYGTRLGYHSGNGGDGVTPFITLRLSFLNRNLKGRSRKKRSWNGARKTWQQISDHEPLRSEKNCPKVQQNIEKNFNQRGKAHE